MSHKNKQGIPDKAVIIIGGIGAFLAASGTLHELVEAASFIFLITFGTVNLIAFLNIDKEKVLSLIGAAGAFTATVILLFRFLEKSPLVLIIFVVLLSVVTLGRTFLYKRK